MVSYYSFFFLDNNWSKCYFIYLKTRYFYFPYTCLIGLLKNRDECMYVNAVQNKGEYLSKKKVDKILKTKKVNMIKA